MKTTLLACTLLGFTLIAAFAGEHLGNPSRSTNKKAVDFYDDWKPAKFKGLKVGESTKEEVLKILGKPDWEGFSEGDSDEDTSPEWWMDYDSMSVMEWGGKLTVILDKKRETVLAVVFYPINLKKNQVIESFGKDFVTTRYAFEPCDESNGGSARIFESKNGQLEYLEYRSRGIAVSFDTADKEIVRAIEYLNSPPGSKISKCADADGR
mgnify:CR=1 FL=1|jgi:hypothetical protein